MKYRHAYHAGNFADVHKHVALLALLEALKRKEKGFLHLETHAGRGMYSQSAESRQGVERFLSVAAETQELRHYASAIATVRAGRQDPHAYAGSPVLAAEQLRAQDRAIFAEIEPTEARALELATRDFRQVRVERGDGFACLSAHLPPRERRGLIFIDPPYEESHKDFTRIEAALTTVLEKFSTAVVAAWYPIKEARDIAAWHARLARKFPFAFLVSELWLYPRDSRVALNGSGLLIANPPYQIEDRMQLWLPELHAALDTDRQGSWRALSLKPSQARA